MKIALLTTFLILCGSSFQQEDEGYISDYCYNAEMNGGPYKAHTACRKLAGNVRRCGYAGDNHTIHIIDDRYGGNFKKLATGCSCHSPDLPTYYYLVYGNQYIKLSNYQTHDTTFNCVEPQTL